MKKVLLGTTALLAASMMSGTALGQARTAMTSTNFNLTLGGFTTFRFEYQNTGPAIDITTQDADGTLTAQPRNHNLDFDAELEFRGAATLSNGVKAGWEVELEAGGTELDDLVDDADPTDADIIDDNYMYLDGRLGKVTLGSVAPTNLAIAAPTTYSSAGGINLNDDDGNALAVAGTNRANLSNGITVSNGVNRISYEPPAIAGFRIYIGYAPDLSKENTTAATEQDDVDATDKDIHIHTQWSGSVMGNRLRLSAGWGTGSPETQVPTAGTDQVSNNDRWRLGGDIEIGDLTLGAHYRHDLRNGPNRLVDETRVVWGIGATYELGVWEFGGGYTKGTTEQRDTVANGGGTIAGSTGEDTATRWDFGVSYTGLGGGKTILVGIRQEKWEDDMNNPDNESKTRSIDVQHNWDVAPGFEFDIGYTNYRYTHHTGLDATDTQTLRTAHGLKIQTKFTF